MTRRPMVVLGVALAIAACNPDLTVPNLNDPGVGGTASRSTVVANAQGLITRMRSISTELTTTFGIWGREMYSLPQEEPRPITDNLIGPRDPNSFGSGSGFNYGTLVNVRSLLQAVDAVEGMTEQEKEAVRGWAQTVAAFAYAHTALVYHEFGAPLEPPQNPTGELAPIATGEELYDRVVALYDEGYQHLLAGGSSFPFALTDGYDGFDTPEAFARVNRALKARALKYRGDWQGVLTALNQSFLSPTGDLDMGVYNNYFASENTFNPYNNPSTTFVHPRILADAQLKANGDKDDRAVSKTVDAGTYTLAGITATEKPNMYPDNSSPFPVITNEELILMRAEAKLATNDPAGALEDVNIVRTRAGGLEPATGLTGDALLTEILYNRRYSLLFRDGFAYWDAKQYDRLDQLPRALPNHVVFDRVNWSANECIARSMTTGPCGPIDGR